MSKARTLLFLGIWVAILPYLGFPSTWKNVLFSLTGLGLIYFAYILYFESRPKNSQREVFDNFSENNNFNKETI